MAEQLDAYHAWLGIPKGEQPANHYRLLGLTLFESDNKVIDTAAYRQIAHVRTYQMANPDEATKILNELSAARVCLLNPSMKSEYDRGLATHQAATVTATASAPTPTLATSDRQRPASAPSVKRTSAKSPRPKKSATTEIAKMVGGGVGGILIACVILWWGFRNDPLGLVAWLHEETKPAGSKADTVPSAEAMPNAATAPKESIAETKPQPENVGSSTTIQESPSVAPSPTVTPPAGPVSDTDPVANRERTPEPPPRVPSLAAVPAPAPDPVAATSWQAGAILLHFPRQSSQKGNEGFIHPAKLGTGLQPAKVVGELNNLRYQTGQNSATFGYFKIDEPGEYVFKTYNHYDRNALFVNGQLVCRYRGSQSGGTDSGGPSGSKERIDLPRGYVPFCLVGYVDARGLIDNVSWVPPSQQSYQRIPQDVVFHDAKLLGSQDAAELWALIQDP